MAQQRYEYLTIVVEKEASWYEVVGAKPPIRGNTPAEVANTYAKDGWRLLAVHGNQRTQPRPQGNQSGPYAMPDLPNVVRGLMLWFERESET